MKDPQCYSSAQSCTDYFSLFKHHAHLPASLNCYGGKENLNRTSGVRTRRVCPGALIALQPWQIGHRRAYAREAEGRFCRRGGASGVRISPDWAACAALIRLLTPDDTRQIFKLFKPIVGFHERTVIILRAQGARRKVRSYSRPSLRYCPFLAAASTLHGLGTAGPNVDANSSGRLRDAEDRRGLRDATRFVCPPFRP